MKRSLCKRTQRVAKSTLTKLEMKSEKITKPDSPPHASVSCPSLFRGIGDTKSKRLPSICFRRTCSVMLLNKENNFGSANVVLLNFQTRQFSTSSYSATSENAWKQAAQTLGSVGACPCPSGPCPCPSGPCGSGCSCLPPPCNTPPKCIQYMSGYYYYPYGTWFCGPYHVATGPCGPCAGPVRPGGPCGPTPPCPGGPCGPACISPCSSCGPLVGCGVCGVNPPNQNQTQNFNTYDPWQYTTNSYAMNYDMYNYNPYDQYGQFNPANTYFGPCYNVPITPTPVQTPMAGFNAGVPASMPPSTSTPMPASMPDPIPRPMQTTMAIPYGQQTNPNPKSSIAWPPNKQKQHPQYPSIVNLTPSPSMDEIFSKGYCPKPTRITSTYPDARSTVTKSRPYVKPRYNPRTLLPLNSIGTCYFSTKCMQKYKGSILNKFRKNLHKLNKISEMAVEQPKKEKKKALNDWSIFDEK